MPFNKLYSPTSTKQNHNHVKLDMDLFGVEQLRDEVASETALCILAEHLHNAAVHVEPIVISLLQQSHLFEFIVSVLDSGSYDRLIDAIYALFPADSISFASSLACTLLSRLSKYFWQLGYLTSDLRDCHRAVDLAQLALKAISSITTFPDDSPTSPVNSFTFEDVEYGSPTKQRYSQRDRKKAKRARAMSIVDSKPFDKLGVEVPRTRHDAQKLATDILSDQRTILKRYLDVLRNPEFAEIYKQAYIPDRQEVVDIPTAKNLDSQREQIGSPSSTNILPIAYPHIQPIKAALYFDSVDGFGEWRILISTRADRNLREAKKKDQKMFRIYLKKIRELSNGHFSDDNNKKLTGVDVGVPVFEAKMTRDTRLVYQVDCVKDFDSEDERQVLRIFGIYTHAQLERRFWDVLAKQLGGRGKEYRRRCIYRMPPIHLGDNVILPAIFPPSSSPVLPEEPVSLEDVREEDMEELHALLVLEKFVTFSQALLNSILADQDVAHVFHMSAPEQNIVKHRGSCYVLGRSGTGKTTTMLFKMLGIERTWDNMQQELEETMQRPRQLFVTQSRVLAEKVEEYYAKLKESHIAAQRTESEAVEIGAKKKFDRQDKGLVDKDEEEYWRGDLPKHFKDLQDDNFPLFLTFDHLERLLEADLTETTKVLGNKDLVFMSSLGADPNGNNSSSQSSDYMAQQRDSFVSYATFLRSYWPHLPQNITKNLDPSLVFAEFMGVIKGSEETLETSKGYLDQESYLSLSHRQQGTFAMRRDAIYLLFQAYVKQKRERREWDAADRTHVILRGLREYGVPGQKVDFVYVDEAQDNLLIDALEHLVLKSICRNPDGMFWAGDTAQTISAGSSFRFNDLKAFLYRLEEKESSLAMPPVAPPEFQLTVNYRSHGGIVRCAHQVVQLITKFWPHAIDDLAEEKGVVDGVRPVFFSGWDQDTMQYEQFLFGASGSQIEFGAQQCILVRDDIARDKLRDQVGDIGLVLTLYESKGLEFNDVLIYNFFEDSTVDISQWRVVLNDLPSKKRVNCPQFDDVKHSGVCRELKSLYVAITRARKNLWIADCSDRGEPMRTLLHAKNLIQNCTAKDNVPRLAMTSTSEEWGETARILFDHKRYLQAVRCYERASLQRERDVAYAYHLREQARGTPASRKATDMARSSAFEAAAQAFLHSASVATVEKVSYYRNAAECFVDAGRYPQAAKAYYEAREFTRSAQLYRKAGRFDEAVNVIKTHQDAINPADADSILTVAKLHYFKEDQPERAMKLFESSDDGLEFMEDYGFDVVRASILEKIGRVSDAAELHLIEGNVIKAVKLFLKDRETETARHRAVECLLHNLWKHLSFGITVKTDTDISKSLLGELLEMCGSIRSSEWLPKLAGDLFDMFVAIARGRLSTLQDLGKKFHTVYNDSISTLLCLDLAFGRGIKIQTLSATELTTILDAFIIYTRELQKIAYDSHPCHNPDLQLLFAFRPVPDSENKFILPHGTYLHRFSTERRPTSSTSMESNIIMDTWHLTTLLQDAVKDRLGRRVDSMNSACSRSEAFSPCLTRSVFGDCMKGDCYHGHTGPRLLDTELFHDRIRILLQAIMIYHTFPSSANERRNSRDRQRSFWLSALYNALHPPHPNFGNLSSFVPSLVPEVGRGLQVVREWIQGLFDTLSPWSNEYPNPFLTTTIQMMSMAFIFDKQGAEIYIPRARCVGFEKPAELLRGPALDQRYIVHDLYDLVSDPGSYSISCGVLFVKTVCDKGLNVDLSALLQLIEDITARFIFAYRSQRYGSLHDMTLPRSWILKYCRNTDVTERDTRLLKLFLMPMNSLINEIYYGSATSHLTLDRKDTSTKNIFVARLCKSLCLLGYNVPDATFRWSVVRIITSLHRPNGHFSFLFRRYVNAVTWTELAFALRDLAPASDGLIQLKKLALINSPIRPQRHVRTVTYTDEFELAALVYQGPNAVPALQEHVQPSAATQSDSNAQVPDSREEETYEEAEEESSADEEDTGIDHAMDPETATSSLDAEVEHKPPPPPTKEELEAADKIAKLYQRLISRRRAAPPTGSAEARQRWFLACLNQSKEMSMRSKYRVFFLGPLPHALVCLENAYSFAIQEKNKAKAKAKKIKVGGLRSCLCAGNQGGFRKLTNAITRLKKVLEPGSALHTRQDTRELRKHVIELKEVLTSLTPTVASDSEYDLKMALKGIIQPAVERKLKPDLVVDEDEW